MTAHDPAQGGGEEAVRTVLDHLHPASGQLLTGAWHAFGWPWLWTGHFRRDHLPNSQADQ